MKYIVSCMTVNESLYNNKDWSSRIYCNRFQFEMHIYCQMVMIFFVVNVLLAVLIISFLLVSTF